MMQALKHFPHRFFRVLSALVISAVLNGFLAAPARAMDAVVGGACGEAEFDAALALVQSFKVGGTITFDCGTFPFFVHFYSNKTITGDVTVDGGGLAILSGRDTNRLFFVSGLGELTLEDITLSNGYSSTGDGGAVYNYYGSLTVIRTKFLDNKTSPEYHGGAIASYGPLTVSQSEFTENQSVGGGAVFLKFATGVGNISSSTFIDDMASTAESGTGGAVLASDGAHAVITSTAFISNHARIDGGGIRIEAGSRLELLNSTLEGNTSVEMGGALSIGGTAAITETVITANWSTKRGGGLYNSGTTRLHASLVRANDATWSGGGIHNGAAGDLEISSSTIFSNTTHYFGAGLYDDGQAAALNSAFIHNVAQGGLGPMGGAIYASGDTLVNFSTFLDNLALGEQALGMAVFSEGASNLALKNSIVKSQGPACSGALTSQGDNIATDLSCSLFQPGDLPSTDPQLSLWQDADGAVWHTLPRPASPAVDQAQCGAVITDQRGSARPVGATCDIGALERNDADPSAYLSLPVVQK